MSCWQASTKALRPPTVGTNKNPATPRFARSKSRASPIKPSNWAWTSTPTPLSSCAAWTTAPRNRPSASPGPSSARGSNRSSRWPPPCTAATRPAPAATAGTGNPSRWGCPPWSCSPSAWTSDTPASTTTRATPRNWPGGAGAPAPTSVHPFAESESCRAWLPPPVLEAGTGIGKLVEAAASGCYS